MWLRCRVRVVLFYLVLLLGNCSGVAMNPKDIEESLHAHNQARAEETARNDEDDEKGDGEMKISIRAAGVGRCNLWVVIVVHSLFDVLRLIQFFLTGNDLPM